MKHIWTNRAFAGESGEVFLTHVIIDFAIENSKIS